MLTTTLLVVFAALLAGGALGWVIAKSNLASQAAILRADLERERQSHELARQSAQDAEHLYRECQREKNSADQDCAGWRSAHDAVSRQLAECRQEHADALYLERHERDLLQREKERLANQVAALEARESAALEKLADQRRFVEEMKGRMEQEFRLIANATLDENSRRISEQQNQKLESTLQPFREQIDAFRRQVDEKFTAEVADRNTLKGELSKVFALTNALTDQTNRLSNALSTNNKAQGNFGEDILEMILQNAGMIEGEHYHKQFHAYNEDGQRIIPDVVLACPDGYSLVIDSKVSLTHYIRYCNEAATPDEEKALRRDIWQSFKAHIDGLSGKKYETMGNCADFVLMFTPVESAFTVAAQHDHDIRTYAFRKKVFLVTPSNLLLVVKMIGDLWQKDRVNKEARDMANRAKALYEKACGFLTTFTEVGAALERAQTQFGKANMQLTGHGGLVRQGEMLQQLIGNDSQKVIPPTLAAQSAAAQQEEESRQALA